MHSPIAIIDRVGFYRKSANGEGREYIIPTRQMERIAEGFNVNQVIGVLRELGMINPPDSTGRSSVVVRLPELGAKRCYIITPITEEHLSIV